MATHARFSRHRVKNGADIPYKMGVLQPSDHRNPSSGEAVEVFFEWPCCVCSRCVALFTRYRTMENRSNQWESEGGNFN